MPRSGWCWLWVGRSLSISLRPTARESLPIQRDIHSASCPPDIEPNSRTARFVLAGTNRRSGKVMGGFVGVASNPAGATPAPGCRHAPRSYAPGRDPSASAVQELFQLDQVVRIASRLGYQNLSLE